MSRRTLVLTGLVPLALAAALGLGLRWLWAGSVPRTTGEVRLAGLSAPATVTWDPRGVPTIEAASFDDALRAQGYVHGLVRPFQVELRRRATAGEIAAFAGARALPLDEYALAHGFREAGARDAVALTAAERGALDAYLAGLNAGLEDAARRLPPALRVARLRPQPWSAADALGFGRRFASGLSNAAATETARLELLRNVGADDAAALWLLARHEPFPPLPQAARALLENAERDDRALARGAVLEEWTARASNAWALAGTRTRDGVPLLAGDPHLEVELPTIWYEVRLRWPGGILAGASLAGVPGVVIGHNADLAWSFTTANVDDADLFLVEVDDVAAPARYREGGEMRPFVTREARVRVKDAPDEVLTLRFAGPARYVGPSGLAGHGLLERWAPREGHGPFPGLHGIMRAATLDEALAAARRFPGPTQNWIAAARGGGIAQAVVGLVPNRRLPGWDGRNVAPWDPAAWDGTIPGDKMPLLRDPPSGYVFHANNAGIAEGLLPGDYEAPFRARRLAERLDALRGATLEDMGALQNDASAGSAAELQFLIKECRLDGEAARLYLAWDGTMRGAGAPLLHEVLRATMLDRVRNRSRLGAAGGQAVARGTFATVNLLSSGLREFWLEEWIDDPATAWSEDSCAHVRTALDEAFAAVRRHAGEDRDAWTWERWHLLAPASPVGVGPLASWFNPPPAGIAGAGDAPLAAHSRLPQGAWEGAPLRVAHAPSYRLLAQLNPDGIRSQSALPGGQDEHPAAPHAWDRLAAFAEGRTDALVPPDAPVGAALRLVP